MTDRNFTTTARTASTDSPPRCRYPARDRPSPRGSATRRRREAQLRVPWPRRPEVPGSSLIRTIVATRTVTSSQTLSHAAWRARAAGMEAGIWQTSHGTNRVGAPDSARSRSNCQTMQPCPRAARALRLRHRQPAGTNVLSRASNRDTRVATDSSPFVPARFGPALLMR